ncbi:hypothetical protein TNCV_1054521 [Trichonephila clavipes]|nr:hypothetical protein TNCV_1054521 [Trichonephila clavipes]
MRVFGFFQKRKVLDISDFQSGQIVAARLATSRAYVIEVCKFKVMTAYTQCCKTSSTKPNRGRKENLSQRHWQVVKQIVIFKKPVAAKVTSELNWWFLDSPVSMITKAAAQFYECRDCFLPVVKKGEGCVIIWATVLWVFAETIVTLKGRITERSARNRCPPPAYLPEHSQYFQKEWYIIPLNTIQQLYKSHVTLHVKYGLTPY